MLDRIPVLETPTAVLPVCESENLTTAISYNVFCG